MIDAAFGASAAFFGQPMADKTAQSPFAPTLNSGYEFMTQVLMGAPVVWEVALVRVCLCGARVLLHFT